MQRISITIEDQLKAELDHITGKGERAVLVTADKRHYEKTQVFGNISLLSELKV